MVLKFLKWTKAPATVICLLKYLFLSLRKLSEIFSPIWAFSHYFQLSTLVRSSFYQIRIFNALLSIVHIKKTVIKLERKHQCAMFFTRKFTKPPFYQCTLLTKRFENDAFSKDFWKRFCVSFLSACGVVFRSDICTMSAEAFNHAFYFRKRNGIDGRH